MKNKPPELWTLDDFKREVRRMDKSLSAKDDSFKVAVVLLAATVHGQSVKRLADVTGYDKTFIEPIQRNLRQSRIWLANGKQSIGDWFEPESGGIAFWMTVAVGMGFVERAV